MSSTLAPVIHTTIDTPRGIAALRDLTPADVDPIAAYLHDENDTHLGRLIDRTRLGTPEDTRRRFLALMRTGESDQRATAFVITVAGKFAGFTNLNRHGPADNYSHWHVTDPSLRAAGLSSLLYPHRIKLYYDLFPIDRLVHQTKTLNVGVNRMLDRYVPVAATRWIERPDGVGSAGEFHLRYVHRADIPHLFTIAAQLAEDRR
jgi:hypothetical protein